jgi:stage II sporulation protein D
MPPEDAAAPTAPEDAAPEVRVGLFSTASVVRLAGSHGLRVLDSTGGTAWTVPAGSTIEARVMGDLVHLRDNATEITLPLAIVLPSDSTGTILVNERAYRGRLELSRGADGVRAINRVSLEDYLVAVVGAEMGRRTDLERAALEAQAVASRTYAVRNLGRFAGEGYDLTADVTSQVYRGVASELPLARLAVEATRGEILTLDGQPIDAFYSSTCGGESERGEAAFRGAARSYLTNVPDATPEGGAWCAISPRYRWQARWDGAMIAATLRRTLAAEGLSTQASDLREVRMLDRTGSGRVAAMELVGSGGRTVVRGANAVRRVLEPPEGGWLPSADFTIRITRSGGRLVRVEADGRGHGHGVGMCQWGAIGRARAGQDYRTILLSYFPGVRIERLY